MFKYKIYNFNYKSIKIKIIFINFRKLSKNDILQKFQKEIQRI